MTLWRKYKPYVLQVALALGVGGLATLLAGNTDLYGELTKPPLSPPSWLFPVAWSILYVLMGIAAGLVQVSGDCDRRKALEWHYLQLAVNGLWPLLFFRFRWLVLSAVWLALLVVLVYVTRRRFKECSSAAGLLMLPYLLWCVFALYLNIGVTVLN